MNRLIKLTVGAGFALTLAACSGQKSSTTATPSADQPAASAKPNPWSSDVPAAEPANAAKAAAPAQASKDAKPKKNPWAKDTASSADEAAAAAEKPAK